MTIFGRKYRLLQAKFEKTIEEAKTEQERVAIDIQKAVENAAQNLNDKKRQLVSSGRELSDLKFLLARTEGQLEEARTSATQERSRFDVLMSRHTWRIGGQVQAHNMPPRLQMECADCPTIVLLAEDSLGLLK